MIGRHAAASLAFLSLAGSVQAEVIVKRPYVTGYHNNRCELATGHISNKRFTDAELKENNAGCITFIDKDGEKFYVRESTLEAPPKVICTPTQTPSKVVVGGQAAGAAGSAKCPS